MSKVPGFVPDRLAKLIEESWLGSDYLHVPTGFCHTCWPVWRGNYKQCPFLSISKQRQVHLVDPVRRLWRLIPPDEYEEVVKELSRMYFVKRLCANSF